MNGTENLTTDSNQTVESEIENGKNRRQVKCQFCKSLILSPSAADFHVIEYQLPLMRQKKSTGDHEENVEFETLKDFWRVADMYTFENIGFSKTVDNKKYLICADCEMGPVGFHDLESKHSYIALNRVNHL